MPTSGPAMYALRLGFVHGGGDRPAEAARRAGPRLPARPARRRAGVRGALRHLSRRRRVHRRLRRAGDRGTLREPQRPHVVPPAPAPDGAHLPRAAAALPLRDRGVRPPRLRPRDLVLERVGARRDRRRRAVHVCYCHNPFRYAWNEREATLATPRARCARRARRWCFSRWRQWDWIAAQRVDRYVANSETTRRRIARYFGARRRRSSTRRWRPTRFTPRRRSATTTSCCRS